MHPAPSHHTTPRTAHDALFDTHARRAFMGAIGRHGYRYDELASGLQAHSMPRPSAGSHMYRTLILRVVASLPHAEIWQVCARIASLYDDAIHTGGALPPEDDGYIAALVADAPALCAPLSAPAHTTHCRGARVWTGSVCTAPTMIENSNCEVLRD